jgi:hypothetical protein
VIWKYATRRKVFLVSQSSHPHFGGGDTWHRTLIREAVNLSSDNHLQTPERNWLSLQTNLRELAISYKRESLRDMCREAGI